MSKEVLKMALEALESLKVTVSSRTEANVIDGVDLFPTQIAALQKALANEALDKMAENARELGLDYEPAQQEPVAVPTTSYEHRKFVLVGRKWYERFAAFHDDCQIGERLTREEQTVRQQGYENGWNDAQRYLREPQASPPTQPQQEPVVIHQFRSPHCSDWYDGVPDHHDGYGPYEVRTLYTSPPAQRTWVGLTDEELREFDVDPVEAKLMIAKLKEKNNG